MFVLSQREQFHLVTQSQMETQLGQFYISLGQPLSSLRALAQSCLQDEFLKVQGSILHSPEGITIPLYYPRGCYIHHAEAVKKATNVPVIGVGRIVDLDMAEKFLQEGKADIIYMGRQLTSDPETPKKYYEGRPEDIRKCIGCLEGCGTPCPINYDISPDAIPWTTAEKAKSVLKVVQEQEA